MRILKPLPGTLPMPERNIVGDWPMNEGSGNVIYDLSGNGNHGTFVDNTKWSQGQQGCAVDFDGAGDLVTIADSPELQFVTGESFTVVASFITDAIGNNGFVGNAEFMGGGYMLALDGDNDLRFTINNDAAQQILSVDNVIYANNWYQAVGVYDGGESHAYLDGVFQKSYGAAVTITASGSPLLIGSGQQGGWTGFDGRVSYVYIFNQALSAPEIAQLYRESFYRYLENRCFAVA